MTERWRRVPRFIIVGVGSNLLLLAVFAALTYAGLAPAVAAVAIYVLGVGISYVGNRQWTFESDAPHLRAGTAFILVHLVGAGAAAAFQLVLNGLLGIPAILVQAIAIVVVGAAIYVMLERWVFRPGSRA